MASASLTACLPDPSPTTHDSPRLRPGPCRRRLAHRPRLPGRRTQGGPRPRRILPVRVATTRVGARTTQLLLTPSSYVTHNIQRLPHIIEQLHPRSLRPLRRDRQGRRLLLSDQHQHPLPRRTRARPGALYRPAVDGRGGADAPAVPARAARAGACHVTQHARASPPPRVDD